MTATATRNGTFQLPYLTDEQVQLLRAGVTAIAVQLRSAAMDAAAKAYAFEDADSRAEHIDRDDRQQRDRFRRMTTIACGLHEGGYSLAIPQADLDALDAEQLEAFGAMVVKAQHGRAWGDDNA